MLDRNLWKIFVGDRTFRADKHYVSDVAHYVVLDETAALLADHQFLGILGEDIEEYLAFLRKAAPEGYPPEVICHPAHAPGAVIGHLFWRALRRESGESPPVFMVHQETRSQYIFPGASLARMAGKSVLLVDDAVNTTTSPICLIGLLTEAGARVVGYYALMNRLPHEMDTALKHLLPTLSEAVRFPAPVYETADCPLCAWRAEYQRLMQEARTPQLRAFLETELRALQIEKP